MIPAKPAIHVPTSAIDPGSGTAFRAEAVICPLPEKVTEGGLPVPVAEANPVAPLKMPVPLRIVKVLEKVGIPIALGAPKLTELVPIIVLLPPLNEAVKLFITADGTNVPEGNITNVIVPASE
jgi:hypothetical protein